MAHKGLLLLSFELMLFIFTAISNAAAVKVDAANSIILDLGSDKQDPRLDVCNKLSGITRYSVKHGTNAVITAVRLHDYRVEMPASPHVEEVFCASPFNNTFTIHFDDFSSDEFTFGPDGMQVNDHKERYVFKGPCNKPAAQPKIDEKVEGENETHNNIKVEERRGMRSDPPPIPKTPITLESKNEVRPELKHDVKHEIKPEIKHEVRPELKHDVKHEIKPEIKHEIRPEVKHEIKEDIRHEIRPEVKHEIKEDIRHEIRPEVKHEIKPEIRHEIKHDVKHEVKEDIKAEHVGDIKAETKSESKSSLKNHGRNPYLGRSASAEAHLNVKHMNEHKSSNLRESRPSATDASFGGSDFPDIEDGYESDSPDDPDDIKKPAYLNKASPVHQEALKFPIRATPRHPVDASPAACQRETTPPRSQQKTETHVDTYEGVEMSAGYADLKIDDFMIEEKSEKEPAKEEVDATPVVPETPLVVERSTREELTFTLGEENPSVVTTTVDDSKCYKGTNGTIIKFIEIEGKTREIMKANAEDTIVCINNSEHSYNIVVGNREEGGKWVHSFYKKSGDHDIFTDVTVKSLFRNIDFSEMFDDAMIMEFSQTEPLHVPKFMFNGKVNASLKQVEANSQSFVLESVTNGYVRIAQDLLFADNGAGLHSFDGMNLVAMYSRSESAHDTLCVTFRHRDVLKHKKYAQINARSGPYQLVPYKREIDYDLSQSLVMFGLSPCSEVTILDAESLGTSAILQGVEVQRFGDIVYIHLQKMDNDILLLIGTVEVLLRSDGNHRIVVMSNDGAVTADISTEIGGVKSRTIVSPKAKEPQVHEVNFVVDPEPSV